MSFAPIKGSYSEKFRELVRDMLQKDPELRPTASDLYTLRLPELVEEEEEEPLEEEPLDITKTKWVWFSHFT